jgi:protease secretion system outer membrane protein
MNSILRQSDVEYTQATGSACWRAVAQVVCLMLAASAGSSWSMDLREAYDAALKNDARIRSSRATADASRERLPQAKAQRLPNVALSVGRNRNDLTSKSANFFEPVTQQYMYSSSNESLTVRMPLYRPYIGAQIDQAQAQVDDAEAMLETDEQGLVVRVGEIYFEALLAKSQLALIAAQKVSFAMQLDAARKSLLAGTGIRTDVDEAQAQVDMVQAQELEIMQNLEFTRRRLEVVTGQLVQSQADLDVAHFRPEPLQPADVQQWIQLAEDVSPELQSMRAQAEVARLEIDKAESGHKPTLDVVAQWTRTDSDTVTSVNTRYNQRAVGLQLTMPLYAGGGINSAVRQAVAGHARAREALEAARQDLGKRVHQEFRSVTEGGARIGALEQAVRSAEQAVLSNRKSLEAGVRTTLDVLNAEKQKTLAQRDLAQARYAYLVSRIRLQSLVGQERWTNIEQANSHLRTVEEVR